MTALPEESHVWHRLLGAWFVSAESALIETTVLSTSGEVTHLLQHEVHYLGSFQSPQTSPAGRVGTHPNTQRGQRTKQVHGRSGTTETSLTNWQCPKMGIHQTNSSCFDTLLYCKVENEVLRMPKQKLPNYAFLKYFYFVSSFSAYYILFYPGT